MTAWPSTVSREFELGHRHRQYASFANFFMHILSKFRFSTADFGTV